MKIKKVFVTLFLCLAYAVVVSAQDVLVTQEGDAFKVYGLEVSPESVFYKLSAEADAPILRMAKSSLLMIKYQDGRKEIMGEEVAPQGPMQPQTQSATALQAMSAAAHQANKEAIERFNRENDVEFTGKADGKKAKLLYCLLKVKEGSVMADENVELQFRTDRVEKGVLLNVRGVTMVVSIKNKTSQTLYLDLGNTFFIRNTQPVAYYIPSATQTSHTTSSGIGMNMGTVAGALGVGGAAGKLAGGLNVGGGNSNTTSSVTYAQRIIGVPPHSSRDLEAQRLFWEEDNSAFLWGNEYNLSAPSGIGGKSLEAQYGCTLNWKQTDVGVGDVHVFNEESNVLPFSIFVTYSLMEDLTDACSLRTSFCLGKTIAIRTSANDYRTGYSETLSDNWKRVVGFFVQLK